MRVVGVGARVSLLSDADYRRLLLEAANDPEDSQALSLEEIEAEVASRRDRVDLETVLFAELDDGSRVEAEGGGHMFGKLLIGAPSSRAVTDEDREASARWGLDWALDHLRESPFERHRGASSLLVALHERGIETTDEALAEFEFKLLLSPQAANALRAIYRLES